MTQGETGQENYFLVILVVTSSQADSVPSYSLISEVRITTLARIKMAKISPFHLSTCARPNILALEPYRCARDDYKDDGTNVLLDANENAYGPGLEIYANGLTDEKTADLHRYPDP